MVESIDMDKATGGSVPDQGKESSTQDKTAVKVNDDGTHPQISGVLPVEDSKVNQLIDKVIDKIVRVTVSDGRIYLGILKSIDKTKTIFV